MTIHQWISALCRQAIQAGLIEATDQVYARNRLLALLHLDDYPFGRDGLDLAAVQPDSAVMTQDPEIPDILDALTDYAVTQTLLEDLGDLREIFAAELMNVFVARPSAVDRRFWQLYQAEPRQATDWFHDFGRQTQYIQTRRLARNISYAAGTAWGELDITINLSKPEKNPRDIAAARLAPSTGYPACLLCVENEGYAGRINHPARANHRMVRLDLGSEDWFFQYSPYAYYNEHCIVLSREHRDMRINHATFSNLLEFVGRFPHYFVGSNADLPIVGGSILTHDHYQGGRYEFAMARARQRSHFSWPAHPAVEFGLVEWPMSVIRARSADPAALVAAADAVLAAWRMYSDPAAAILAMTDGTPHNTITPIARRRGPDYELDLVLRNNRQDDAHPMGIFHPQADVHHIKQENIGLIEVMGLAVLPARLVPELAAVEQYLVDGQTPVETIHQGWADDLRHANPAVTDLAAARQIVRAGVAAKFARVLADAGVFKQNAAGLAAFDRFIASLVTGRFHGQIQSR